MATNRSIMLRNIRDKLGIQSLSASLFGDGKLTITGQDLGDGVEQFFGAGSREYEWIWTIQSPDVTLLISALDLGDDVLVALAERFSNDAASDLKPFLDEQKIPYECWSRIGD